MCCLTLTPQNEATLVILSGPHRAAGGDHLRIDAN
jgi:hypothetical protein